MKSLQINKLIVLIDRTMWIVYGEFRTKSIFSKITDSFFQWKVVYNKRKELAADVEDILQ